MPRIPSRRPGGGRALPWMELVAAARWAYDRVRDIWEALEPREREDLRRLLEKSRGRPANLTSAEQRRVRDLAMKAWMNRGG